jgi:hypothetical protein
MDSSDPESTIISDVTHTRHNILKDLLGQGNLVIYL